MSQSDIDLEQDQTASDMDNDFQQPSTSKEGPQVVLSPDKFRIRDKDDEEEHNDVRIMYNVIGIHICTMLYVQC